MRILLNDGDRGTLRKWIKSRAIDSKQKRRAKIILAQRGIVWVILA